MYQSNSKKVFSDVVLASNAPTGLRAQRFPAAVQKANPHVTRDTFVMHVLRALAKAEWTLRK